MFNRLAGKKLAIVGDEVGVTRDIREVGTKISFYDFKIFDTAGIDPFSKIKLKRDMTSNSISKVCEGNLVIFLLDGRSGILKDDFEVSDKLRKNNSQVILAINKCEGNYKKEVFSDSFSLGFGEPILISAEHGLGLDELKEAIIGRSQLNIDRRQVSFEVDESLTIESNKVKPPLNMSIVGRPNSGKSTLFNLLLDEDRSLTGVESGLTRDAVSVVTTWNGDKVKLFDTAGIRRKNKVNTRLEKLSVRDSLRAINFSEVVIILLDLVNAFDTQDLKIAELVGREGRLPVFAVNKWDLEKEKSQRIKILQENLEKFLPQFSGAELVPVSAKTGYGIKTLNKIVKKYHNIWQKRISTSELNLWLADQISHHPPPIIKGRRIKIRYVTQAKSRPPTFIFFGTRSNEIPKSYERFLINSLRSNFEIIGVPIRVIFRSAENPYSS